MKKKSKRKIRKTGFLKARDFDRAFESGSVSKYLDLKTARLDQFLYRKRVSKKKFKGFQCAECGYTGIDFRSNLETYSFCVGEWIGPRSFINPIRQIIKEDYERRNALRGWTCPICLAPLRISRIKPRSK